MEGKTGIISRLMREASFFDQPLAPRCRLAILIGVLALIPALFFPLWHMTFRSNQYPDGLSLHIYASQLEGGKTPQRDDLREINALNHYIGMRKLNEAAAFERSISMIGIAGLALLILAAVYIHNWWAALLTLPALLLPAIFLGDLQYWLANFGQNLDPHAPLSSSIKPFVPPVLGVGKIAQFSTTSNPELGLWLACGASVLILVGLWFHRRAYKPLVDAKAK